MSWLGLAARVEGPGDMAGDRDVLVGAHNLVDLVNEDDPLLVRAFQQAQKDVLYILADVAGIGQGRCVVDGKGDIKDVGEQGLDEPGVPMRTSRARPFRHHRGLRACNRKDLLGQLLADDIFLELLLDLCRGEVLAGGP